MEALKLSEKEQKNYSELFQVCDAENTGRVSSGKASELLKSSGLPADVLFQIFESCGAKRLGHFGRSQFYIALKLVAAAQSGLPVKFESFNSGTDLSLPKFAKQHMEQDARRTLLHQVALQSTEHERPVQNQGKSGSLPPPPSKQHIRTLSGAKAVGIIDASVSVQMNSSMEMTRAASPPMSPRERPHKLDISTSAAQSAPVTSPTSVPLSPTQAHVPKSTVINTHQAAPPSDAVEPAVNAVPTQNGVMPKHNEVAQNHTKYSDSGKNRGELEKKSDWASFDEEDSQGLIGPKKEWVDVPEHLKQTDTSSVTSSEAESECDVWTISDEQKDYYMNQFKTMQQDPSGLILGATAKEFFEKSKLPVKELSKIWMLSDVDKDGALSLEEFCIAMHLVVLRRNEVELPDTLPPSLMPYMPLSNEPFSSDLPPGSTLKRLTPSSPHEPVTQLWNVAAHTNLESPTSSSVSSPGTKPVNFEFKPITADSDSKIIHPVALRMSPEGPVMEKSRTLSDPAPYDSVQEGQTDLSPTKPRSQTESFVEMTEMGLQNKFSAPLHPRPRPTPKKALPVVQSPRQSILQPPPLHNSDLSTPDKYSSQTQIAPPPAVPPRVTPKDALRQASPDTELSSTMPASFSRDQDSPTQSLGATATKMNDPRSNTAEKREIQAVIRQQKERNTKLSRLNSELNQELQEVMEQRIALEIQLEHLRPFAS